jgi:hypothetical protein
MKQPLPCPYTTFMLYTPLFWQLPLQLNNSPPTRKLVAYVQSFAGREPNAWQKSFGKRMLTRPSRIVHTCNV